LEEVNHKGKNLVLDKNEIYIIGENLPESIDSREYGPILTNQILGKVVLSF
jgi:type IV secretory pathway protease TraF